MDNVPKETHAVSVMTHKTLGTKDKVRDAQDDRLLLHSIRRQKKDRLTARDTNPHRDLAVNRKIHWTRVKFHADSSSVKIRHVNSGILPCVGITSLKKDVYMATHDISDMMLKESIQLVCVFQDSYPRKSILREPGVLGSKHAVEFSNGTWKEIVHREVLSKKCAPHERSPCAPKFEERSHGRP